MAIDEFNAKGGVLGRKIESVTADTETTPATGTRIAERFITREDCSILIGALHSGVANAITQVANKYGTIYLNTNSSAPSEAGENCSRVKFVWDGNGTNFTKAAVRNAVNSIGKNWLLLTNDYVWGHSTSAATKHAGRGRRGHDRRQPAGAAEHARLHVVSAQDPADRAGRGRHRHRRRRHQGAARSRSRSCKLGERPAWINNQQDWPDVWGAPDSLFGVFGTTWYHKLPLPGVADFVKKWQAANKGGPIPVPGNVSYNGYMATRELLRAIERAGSTNNVKIIKELENLKDVRDGSHAALRCLHEPGHASDAADHLSGAQEPEAGRQHRPLRDHQLDRAEVRWRTTSRPASASSCPTSRCRRSMPDRLTHRPGRAVAGPAASSPGTSPCSICCRTSSTA